MPVSPGVVIMQVPTQTQLVLVAALLVSLVRVLDAACVPIQVDGQYRKDFFLPEAVYGEGLPNPTAGGRIHLVATSPTTLRLPLKSVQINGVEALNLGRSQDDDSQDDFQHFDWTRAYYNNATREVWVSFHSRNTHWLPTSGQAPPLTLMVQAQDNLCVQGTYSPVLTTLNLTWATPVSPAAHEPVAAWHKRQAAQAGQQQWVAHVANGGPTAYTLSSFIFDGAKVVTKPALPQVVQPNSHLVLLFQPPHGDKARNDVFTVRLGASDGSTAVSIGNGGRTPDARFPIEVWPHSEDCPVPTVNANNWASLASHSIDTVYYAAGNFQKKCGQTFQATATRLAHNTCS